MKQCSNPTCAHQVEDHARFCGMCGTYVGPEMTSDTTLADAQVKDRIQQCRDLINSIQSEPDEKEKAQKIRTVMDIFTSINTNQLPSKPIAHAAEQIQVLSTVVQEMITLPSISPTASAADMQHWPISPLEMRQWTEILIALTGSNKFSSLDKATKSTVRGALGRFISFVGINARSNPDTEQFLLDLYESIIALSAPELQGCFSGVDKGKLFHGVEQQLQRLLSSASPSITPAQVQIFVGLALEELFVPKLGQQALERRTRETIETLEQIQRLRGTNAPLNEAVVKAYAALLLQSTGNNEYLQGPKADIRLDVVSDLAHASLTMATIHYVHVPETAVSLVTDSISVMILTPNYPRGKCIQTVETYIDLLHEIVANEQDRKEELRSLAERFSSRISSALPRLDPSLNRRFYDLYSSELAK